MYNKLYPVLQWPNFQLVRPISELSHTEVQFESAQC